MSEELHEDSFVAYSDEEIYTQTNCEKGKLIWTPEPEHILNSFQLYQSNNLNLEWETPMKRPVSEDGDDEDEEDEENLDHDDDLEGTLLHEKAMADFDFGVDDEDLSATPTPRRLHGGNRELKGSARKKTTNFNNILSNMRRHRNMDAAAASESSVITTSSTTVIATKSTTASSEPKTSS